MQDETSNVPEFVQLDPFSAGARPHGFGTPWIKCLKESFLVEEMQFMDGSMNKKDFLDWSLYFVSDIILLLRTGKGK